MTLPYWLVLIIAGLVVYVITRAPVFPPEWKSVTQGLGGILVVVGIVIFVLGLLGVGI